MDLLESLNYTFKIVISVVEQCHSSLFEVRLKQQM